MDNIKDIVGKLIGQMSVKTPPAHHNIEEVFQKILRKH
jgi:hypothetical protein